MPITRLPTSARVTLSSFIALAAAACSSSSTPMMMTPPPPVENQFSRLTTDGKAFRDTAGRTVVLHGVNARVEGIFDVTFSDGRLPLEAVPGFDAADAAAMRQLGFDLLRLPINWSGIEPVQGTFSTDYLDRIAKVVDLCRAQKIWVLLDLHQDAYSKEIGEDGAPLWAIVPAPQMLLGGPLDDLFARRTSAQVLDAFNSLFVTDQGMVQEAYADMLKAVAQRFAGDDAVLGYEIFNEPNYTITDEQVQAFNAKMAQAIRSVDSGHAIVFEPSADRNQTDRALVSATAFPVAHAVYAPHVYTDVFFAGNKIADLSFKPELQASVHAAGVEAAAWQTPLLIGEFGVGPTQTNALAWLTAFYDAADAELASTALWLWKELSQGSWGLYDHQADGSWTLRSDYAATVARGHVQAIAGTITRMQWDGSALSVDFTADAAAGGAHEVYFPADSIHATCDGRAATTRQTTSARVFQVECAGAGAHTIVVSP